MKNGKDVKNYYASAEGRTARRQKKATLATLKIGRLVSWPKDKEQLLFIINNFLSLSELDKLDNILNMDEIEERAPELEKEKVVKEEAAEESEEETEDAKSEDDAETTDEENLKEEESEEVTPEPEDTSDDNVVIEEGEYAELPDQLYHVENCSAKVLGSVVRILSFRSRAIRKIRLMRKARMDNELVNSEIEKVAVYNIVLAKFLPILNKQDIIDKVNLKTATKLFEDVCVEGYQEIPTQSGIESEIKKNKEDQDFDIVAALNYVGVTVDRDDYGYYTVKNYNNGKGIKYFIGKAEKSFPLSKNSCHKFVDEFLNKPIEKRKFITPGQVFIQYIGEAEKGLGLNTRSAVELSGLFGTMNSSKNAKQYFKDVIKKFSRNAEEWKDFQRLFEGEYYSNKEGRDEQNNKVLIRQQAKRLVIGELFEDIINYGDILTNDQLQINDYRISDITRDFGLDFSIDGIDVNKVRIEHLEDQAFRIINSMHSILQQMRAFMQDIIDNYTVDYLRKEKIFLLQQDDQNEFISKKKEYESLIKKLSYDKGKDSASQTAYYQSQVDELTQKIGNKDYLEAKNVLLKSKNQFRVLLINAKSQKEKCIIAINEARERAERERRDFTVDDQINIMREVLSSAPELIVTFDKGKATSWTKHKIGEKAVKQQEPLSEVDKVIEATAAKISDESHQKILQENLIREKVKKSQKEERVKSVNAYINAYGSIVGGAMGVGAYGGTIPNVPVTPGPTFAPQVAAQPAPNPAPMGMPAGTAQEMQAPTVATPRNIANLNAAPPMYGDNQPKMPLGTIDPMVSNTGYSGMSRNNLNIGFSNSAPAPAPASSAYQAPVNNVSTGNMGGGSARASVPTPAPVNNVGGQMNNMGGQGGTQGGGYVMPTNMVMPNMYGGGMMPMGGMPAMPENNQPNYNRDYQNFDFVSESIEPCVIPYIVGYEDKGATIYGNMMEKYSIMDRYKFLLTTNNNALYSYIETKQGQIQTPEQIISDLHIRYVKNAMGKSGLSTQDSNLASFDYKGDIRRFLGQYVPQNLIDMVISDYEELISTVDFELLKDLISHKFQGDLEGYIPDEIKEGVIKSTNMIASVGHAIMSNPQVRKTYDAYSSKMKQTYVSTLIGKIDSGEVPTIKLNSEDMYARILDYLSFSIKGQNVIIQSEDNKDSGLGTYPRSVFFRQKDNADQALRRGKILTYEQNEVITTRNEPMLEGLENNVMNLFGTLYKFNGAYNKLLLKLKPFTLQGGVKFMENMVDALNEKIDLKVTVLNQDKKQNTVSLVKFASVEKNKVISEEDKVFDYDDENWFVRKGFVLEKNKVKEYYLQLAFGFKYALEHDKASLKADFYNDNLLSLNKINEKFKDFPENTVSLITSVIRDVMMSRCERIIDYIAYINERSSIHINKMLYIARTILESNNFNQKTKDEKLETVIALDQDFNVKSEDIANPHPEIYSTTSDIERYEGLYMYYGLTELFEKMGADERLVCPQLTEYFEDLKKKYRSSLLAMIRDRVSMNGYEQDLARYFELKVDNMKSVEAGVQEEEEDVVVATETVRLQNIDIMFKGILDGYNKAIKAETNTHVLDEMKVVGEMLELIGTLPTRNTEEKELEISLPNNQSIRCNVKGFLQQYLFRYIVDKEHELGPFAYVVSELAEHEELGESVKNIEIVANKLNAPELGINLIAKFSTISLSNNGNIFKIGDNISTVLDTVNRLKTPTDQQKALNRDVFYKEGVEGVKELFEQYFTRLKVENME